MKNLALPFIALVFMFVTACETQDEELGSEISGTYVMQTYETQAGPSTPGVNDQVVVTDLGSSTVRVLIDYASEDTDDVELNPVNVSKSGSTYKLSQTFPNASVSGEIKGSSMTLEIDYTDGTGDFVNITAEN